MTTIKDNSIQQFLDALASKSSTPGGGSTAALLGAQAAALVSMVCNLTIGKSNYAEVETEMLTLLEQSETLRGQLTAMIQADVEAFDRFMATYRLPKETEVENKQRSELIQQLLIETIEIPMSCARACRRLIDLSRIAAEKGNVNVISDAGVAVMSAFAGLESASLNVLINVSALSDRSRAARIEKELDDILKGSNKATEEIYHLVKAKL